MSREITPSGDRPENALAETLEQLAERANQAHTQAIATAQNAVEHALAAGQALLEAKKRCQPGAWHVWLTKHFRGSIRTAQGYMRLAVHSPQIKYDAHRGAHLSYKQLRCLLAGLAATDGRSPPKRDRLPLLEAAASMSPSPPPEQRGCGAPTCVPIVQVGADFHNVAEALLETLRELAELAKSPSAGDYALHLFERLRMVYFGLARGQWFHEWPVKNP